jgi:hypothetical protein
MMQVKMYDDPDPFAPECAAAATDGGELLYGGSGCLLGPGPYRREPPMVHARTPPWRGSACTIPVDVVMPNVYAEDALSEVQRQALAECCFLCAPFRTGVLRVSPSRLHQAGAGGPYACGLEGRCLGGEDQSDVGSESATGDIPGIPR